MSEDENQEVKDLLEQISQKAFELIRQGVKEMPLRMSPEMALVFSRFASAYLELSEQEIVAWGLERHADGVIDSATASEATMKVWDLQEEKKVAKGKPRDKIVALVRCQL